jgi:hypothetical protein
MATPSNFAKVIVQKDEWPKLVETIIELTQYEIQVGVHTPGGTHHHKVNIATRAYRNEMGIDAPKRPAWQKTISERRDAWQERARRALVWKGRRQSIRHILTSVGKMMRLDIRRGIVEFDNPPNARATIAKKGFDNPLVETGEYFRAIQTKYVRIGRGSSSRRQCGGGAVGGRVSGSTFRRVAPRGRGSLRRVT